MYYMNEVIDNEYKRLSKILEYIENSEEDYSYLINRCRGIFEEKKRKMKEEISGTAEVRETYKISKVGTIAGCMVLTGKIYRNSGVRIIREGIVVYTGTLSSLKRFKDDVKEVAKGYDCGLQIKNYNDIKNEDIVEFFQEVAVKKTL